MKTFERAVLVLVFVAIGLVGAARAQSNSDATISGKVKDPQSANVPGASVTLYGRDRTFSLVTTTDSSGAYNFKHLAPGDYLIAAEPTGLALANAQTIPLTRGEAATVDIALQLSSLRNSVVVTASDTPQTV